MFWIKKSSGLLGNDCHLLKGKSRDTIIETIKDRAHTVFMKTIITLRRNTQKSMSWVKEVWIEKCQWHNSDIFIFNAKHTKTHSPALSLMILKKKKKEKKRKEKTTDIIIWKPVKQFTLWILIMSLYKLIDWFAYLSSSYKK